MAVSYPWLKCLGALWGAQEHLCLQERISEESLEKTQLFEKMQRERSTGRKLWPLWLHAQTQGIRV